MALEREKLTRLPVACTRTIGRATRSQSFDELGRPPPVAPARDARRPSTCTAAQNDARGNAQRQRRRSAEYERARRSRSSPRRRVDRSRGPPGPASSASEASRNPALVRDARAHARDPRPALRALVELAELLVDRASRAWCSGSSSASSSSRSHVGAGSRKAASRERSAKPCAARRRRRLERAQEQPRVERRRRDRPREAPRARRARRPTATIAAARREQRSPAQNGSCGPLPRCDRGTAGGAPRASASAGSCRRRPPRSASARDRRS